MRMDFRHGNAKNQGGEEKSQNQEKAWHGMPQKRERSKQQSRSRDLMKWLRHKAYNFVNSAKACSAQKTLIQGRWRNRK